MVLSIGYLTVYKMHQLSVFVFFTVAVTVVVVTNLPVNFAVDLAGAMRQGRQHLFHLARTHKQAATHTHTHTQSKRKRRRLREGTKRRKELRATFSNFSGILIRVPLLGTHCRCTSAPLSVSPCPPPPLPHCTLCSSCHTLYAYF